MSKIFRVLIKSLAIIAITLFLLCVATISYWIYQTNYVPFQGAKFDRELWLSADNEDFSPPVRCSMLIDLQENHLHVGMSKTEIENLLGKIDHYFYCLDKKIKCTSYSLGPCTMPSQDLCVCFDQDEKLTTALRNTFPCKDEKMALCYVDKTLCRCSKIYETHAGLVDCEVEKW